MKQVEFHILESATSNDKHRLACQLAGQISQSGSHLLILCRNDEELQLLDNQLWLYQQISFLSHCLDDADQAIKRHSKILLSSQIQEWKGNHYLVALHPEISRMHCAYQHIHELVAGDDADKSAGRKRFLYYKKQGISPIVHQNVVI